RVRHPCDAALLAWLPQVSGKIACPALYDCCDQVGQASLPASRRPRRLSLLLRGPKKAGPEAGLQPRTAAPRCLVAAILLCGAGDLVACAQLNMLTIQSLAKVNLDLRILHKRPDGFHELRTVFQTISLADTLKIEYEPAKRIQLTIDSDIPDNLIIRAAHAVLA